MKKSTLIYLLLLLYNLNLYAQVIDFQMPDTVCVGQDINIINLSTNWQTYKWNFCQGDVNQSVVGVSLGNPGSGFVRPDFLQVVKDGSNYIGLVSNDRDPNIGYVSRLNFGNSIEGIPVHQNLGDFGGKLNKPTNLKLIKEGNNWYCFYLNAGLLTSDYRLVRLDFGNSLLNTPSITDFGNIGNYLNYPLEIDIIKLGNKYIGFITNLNNTLQRIDFGADITSTPTIVNLGNVGGLSRPTNFKFVFNSGKWYMFLVNDNTNTITRLDFGTSLENIPTGKNLGNPNGSLNRPLDIMPYFDCGDFKALILNAANNNVVQIDFINGVESQVIESQNLGNIGSLNYPGAFSNLLYDNGSKYAFVINTLGNSISRLKFSECNSLGISTSGNYSPPVFSLSDTGRFLVQLIIDEGLPSEFQLCKNVVVIKGISVFIGKDTTYCGNFSRVLTTGNPNTLWSTGQTGATITVTQGGTFWAQVTQSCGAVRDSIVITKSQLVPIFIGNDTTYCGNLSRVLTTGNPATTWSTGQTGASITVTQAGTYWAEVTQPCGLVSDSITLAQRKCSEDTIIICKGDSVELCGKDGFDHYIWHPNTALNNDTTKCVIAKPTETIKYYVQGNSSGGNRINLVPNGDFEQGYKEFNSEYSTPINGSFCNYDIDTIADAHKVGLWCKEPDHSINGKNMMIVDGCPNTPLKVWYDTIIVDPNTAYEFEGFVMNNYYASQAILDVTINDVEVVKNFSAAGTCNWDRIYGKWNSGVATSAIIIIRDNITVSSGNDFILDDIGLYKVASDTSYTDSILVIVNDLPVKPNLDIDTAYCGDFSKILTTGDPTTLWSTGQTGASLTVTQPDIYWAEISNDCGSVRDSIIISIGDCGCYKVALPNSFSPNDDNINDIYKPITDCPLEYLRFMIFNRWGEKVFETNDVNIGWDGKFKGLPAPVDSFAWYLEYNFVGDETKYQQKGMVTLIR